MPQHFVTKLARDDGTIVVQVGEGADEIFHGYNGYVDTGVSWCPSSATHRVPYAAGSRVALEATTRLGRGIRQGEALYDAAMSELPYWGGAVCFRGPHKRQIAARNGFPDAYRTVENGPEWAS